MNKKKKQATLTLLVCIMTFLNIILTLIFAGSILLIMIQTKLVWQIPPSPLRVLLLMLLISVIMGFLAAASTSRFSTGPINKLIQQTNRLGAGDFKTRLHFDRPFSRHSTFKELENSFNKMAAELEQTEMLRSDFINNFSHEFKTPIVSIAGFAKLLRRGNLTETQQQEYLEVIETESLRLSKMATNVLNMTRVENLSILKDISTYNLSEQIRSCILLFENQWEQKQIDFDLDFDEYNIDANEELLKQVWINLLDNALKFSPQARTIRIQIHETQDKFLVSIANTGPSLSPKEQKKIFNKFYQSDESHSVEGNGIGLAIVKRVAELHHGTVSVSSEDDYTTFTVTLPKVQ